MPPERLQLDGMARPGPLLLLWAPSKLISELRNFLVPELREQYRVAALRRAGGGPAPPPPPLSVQPLGDGMLARADFCSQAADHGAATVTTQRELFLEAARGCTLISAVLQPLAAAPTADQAAAAAAAELAACRDGSPAQHPLRALSVDSRVARAPAQRALQQRLQRAGLGTRPLPGLPPLWCIQLGAPPAGGDGAAGPQQPAEVVIGLQLEAGCPAPPAAARQLGPTAMLPQLAALSASLAGVQPGSSVLDPFCGTASLLTAALHRGAGLAVGSDVDATHFGPLATGGVQGGIGSSGTLPILLQADAARLHALLPPSCVDCIITDLPYGHRTAVEACGTVGEAAAAGAAGAAAAAGWEHLQAVLLRLAAHALVPQGRLLTWLPAQHDPAQQEEALRRAGREQGLRLLRLIPESRQRGYPRALALFDLQAGPPPTQHAGQAASGAAARRLSLLAALRVAAGALPAHNVPPEGSLPPAGEAAAVGAAQAQAGQAPGVEAAEKAVLGAGAAAGVGATADAAALPGASERRALPYRQARRAAAGTAIDVWRAAWLGDSAAVSEYAAAGGEVDARDRRGQTPLQFAAGYGREAAVSLLLRLGADPCAAADAGGMPPLHRAAARGHATVARLLLAGGADPWQRVASHPTSPEAPAIEGGPPARAPSSGGGRAAGQTAVMLAAQFGHLEALRLLLAHLSAAGTDEERRGSSSGCGSLAAHLALRDSSGLAALHLAAQWGMAEAADALLEAGADPNQPTGCPRRRTAAHLAAAWGHAGVLRVLRRHGADLGRPCGAWGWPPLREAQEWRRQECAELLLGWQGEEGAGAETAA